MCTKHLFVLLVNLRQGTLPPDAGILFYDFFLNFYRFIDIVHVRSR